MKLSVLLSGAAMACALALPAQSQTLDEAFTLAEVANPTLESSKADADIARAALDEARAAGGVTVSLSASGGYESIDSNRAFSPNIGERPTANVQLEAARPIYTGGRVAAGIRAAEAGIDAASANLEATRQQLFLETATAFLDVKAARETLDIRGNNVELLREQVEAATARFDVGFVTRTDVALTEARLAGALAGEAAAAAGVQAAIADFIAVTDAVPGDLGPTPPLPVLPENFEEALEFAVLDNPQLLALREQERSASEAIDQAKAAGRLQLEIVGTASGQQEFKDDEYDTTVSALARGSIPLWQSGLVDARVSQARLRRDQARLNTNAAERDIRAGLASAWFGYEAALLSIEASVRQVEAAEIAFDGARQELTVGTRTTLDVLDSEQDLLDARLSLVNAERDAQVAAYQVLQLTGGLSRAAVLSAGP
ncbi:MAG: TolC family outer membrane protein [Pseudomonadota bacterium]